VSKILLQVIAAMEAGAGAGLVLFPSAIVGLLISGSVDSLAALAVTRIAGAALVTLGLICWFASRDSASRTAIGVVTAMSFYNITAACVLLYARIGNALTGLGMWPAIVMPDALAGSCLACARRIAV